MTERPRFFDDLAGVAGGAFSALAGIREEAESMVRARVEEAIRKLDLVKREDLEAVMEMAANARTGQEAAEIRLAALEARVASMSGAGAPGSGMSGSGMGDDDPGASEADPASLPPKAKPSSHGGGTSEVAPGTMPPGEPGSPGPSPDGAP